MHHLLEPFIMIAQDAWVADFWDGTCWNPSCRRNFLYKEKLEVMWRTLIWKIGKFFFIFIRSYYSALISKESLSITAMFDLEL